MPSRSSGGDRRRSALTGRFVRTPDRSIVELIERSSLGTPDAVAARASVPVEVAAKVVARARELEAEQS